MYRYLCSISFIAIALPSSKVIIFLDLVRLKGTSSVPSVKHWRDLTLEHTVKSRQNGLLQCFFLLNFPLQFVSWPPCVSVYTYI